MAKFRIKEKKYALPALASIGTGIMNAANVVGTATAAVDTVNGIVQSRNQNKMQEKMHEDNMMMQARQNRRMADQMRQQNKMLEKIASSASKNPMAANQALDVMKTKSYSNSIKEKSYSSRWRKAWDTTKELGKVFWKNYNKEVKIGTALGIGMTGTGYVVDKIIQKDLEKDGTPVEGTKAWHELQNKDHRQVKPAVTRSYSNTASKVGKAAWNFLKNNKGSIIMGSVMSSIPLATHFLTKASRKEQVDQSQQFPEPIQLSQRGYSAAAVTKTITSASRKLPGIGSRIANFMSHASGGGGRKRAVSVMRYLSNSNNEYLKKAGQFMSNHGTLTTAMTVVPGALAFAAGDMIANKGITAAAKLFDKDAFAYQRQQEQQAMAMENGEDGVNPYAY